MRGEYVRGECMRGECVRGECVRGECKGYLRGATFPSMLKTPSETMSFRVLPSSFRRRVSSSATSAGQSGERSRVGERSHSGASSATSNKNTLQL